ncbi:MAG: hypothetical protein ACTS6G_00130 [Candidatus Hodgkinia cicadicola]
MIGNLSEVIHEFWFKVTSEREITNKLVKGFYVLLTSGWEERKFG